MCLHVVRHSDFGWKFTQAKNAYPKWPLKWPVFFLAKGESSTKITDMVIEVGKVRDFQKPINRAKIALLPINRQNLSSSPTPILRGTYCGHSKSQSPILKEQSNIFTWFFVYYKAKPLWCGENISHFAVMTMLICSGI